jgi:glycosyltransferase involved in cell wall biosynthesis/O-antigen/teichoic acid export membrane protein
VTVTDTAPVHTVGPTGPSRRLRAGLESRPEAILILSSASASVANYAYTLAVLWLLPASQYAVFGSVAALLLLCGTISSASTPWVVAREVARSDEGSERRVRAVTFGLVSVSVQGIAAGIATGAVAAHYASGPTVAVVLGASVAIFIEAAGIGYLQGLERFSLIAVLRVLEVVAKIVAGVALIELHAGALGAIAGFLLGAAVVTVITLVRMRPDLRWVRGALRDRRLWVSSRGLLGVQAGVAVLAGMDIVIGSLALTDRDALATYQAAQILGRIPVFVGTALSLVLFARLAKAGERGAATTPSGLALFIGVSAPVAAAVGTLPVAISGLLFPAGYGDVSRILPLVAVGGLAMGFVNLLSTVFQALQSFAPAIIVIWAGVVLGLPVDYFALRADGIVGLAWAVVGVGLTVSLVLAVVWSRIWGVSGRRPLIRLALTAVLVAPLVGLRPHPVAWLAYLLVVVTPVLGYTLLRFGSESHRPSRPRVLHLGFEDPAQPGSGGGSARTHEINKRIAGDVEVTVVCAAYPGCRSRVEDGVRYVHVGLRRSGHLAQMTYFAAVPYALWRYRSDLVVEDFGAPISSIAVPWLTDRPVIGMVQWLFAVEKSKQYHLPFAAVERIGLAAHRHLVTVSEDLGVELRRRNPRASVTVIENGLRDDAFARPQAGRGGLAFIGRLEIAQKGLDLLVKAYSLAATRISQDLVIAGDGPDRDRLIELAEERGVADRVHLVGRVEPARRGEWLAGFDLLVMPSRYETFGLVAAEASAAATPVVAFDIPCLRNLVTEAVGVRVPAFDVVALADAIVALASDEPRRRKLGDAGPAAVAGLRWDELAATQLHVYRSMLPTAVSP